MSDTIDFAEIKDLVPEGAMPIGMLRIAFYIKEDGAPEAAFQDHCEHVTFRELVGELEFVKHFYVERILKEGWPSEDDDG